MSEDMPERAVGVAVIVARIALRMVAIDARRIMREFVMVSVRGPGKLRRKPADRDYDQQETGDTRDEQGSHGAEINSPTGKVNREPHARSLALTMRWPGHGIFAGASRRIGCFRARKQGESRDNLGSVRLEAKTVKRLAPGIPSAILAALLFGASTPIAKRLLGEMPPQMLAGLLYLLGLRTGRIQQAASTLRRRSDTLPRAHESKPQAAWMQRRRSLVGWETDRVGRF